jgi:hypothetical protein
VTFQRIGLVLVLVLTLAADWERVADRDGIVVESRDVEGSSLHELRITVHSPLPPATIMDTLWKHEEYVQFIPYMKRLDVRRDDGDTRFLYEQINVPLLKDRDLMLRVTRAPGPEGGWEVRGVAVPDPASESKDYVRVRTMESRWQLVPDAGGTAVTYGVRTDPGGWFPAWMVNRAQREVTVRLVRAMLDRASANEARSRTRDEHHQ